MHFTDDAQYKTFSLLQQTNTHTHTTSLLLLPGSAQLCAALESIQRLVTIFCKLSEGGGVLSRKFPVNVSLLSHMESPVLSVLYSVEFTGVCVSVCVTV